MKHYTAQEWARKETAMKYAYTFDQLRDVPAKNTDRLFLSLEATVRLFGAVDLSRYYAADHGIIEAPDPITACERLFAAYNADTRPAGYSGRCMSVSDVVRLWDNSVEPPKKSTWFCDSIGFKRLED